jgi:DNA ligase-4
MCAIDQYHLGFTMRFPRAMAIREDLSVADCATASGAMIRLYGFRAFFLTNILAILETVRSEKKRKMENVAEFVFYVLVSRSCEC